MSGKAADTARAPELASKDHMICLLAQAQHKKSPRTPRRAATLKGGITGYVAIEVEPGGPEDADLGEPDTCHSQHQLFDRGLPQAGFEWGILVKNINADSSMV